MLNDQCYIKPIQLQLKLEKRQNEQQQSAVDISDINYNIESKGVNKLGKEELVFTSGEQMEKTMAYEPNYAVSKENNQNGNPKKKKNKNRAKKK